MRAPHKVRAGEKFSFNLINTLRAILDRKEAALACEPRRTLRPSKLIALTIESPTNELHRELKIPEPRDRVAYLPTLSCVDFF